MMDSLRSGRLWVQKIEPLLLRVPPPLVQYAKFGFVGGLATAFHSFLFVIFVELLAARPMIANTLAFCCAVIVSYLGNYRWTFGAASRSWKSFIKFLIVSLIGFALNSLFILIIIDGLHRSYLYSLPFMIGVVPVVVFLLNRKWTFGSSQPG